MTDECSPEKPPTSDNTHRLIELQNDSKIVPIPDDPIETLHSAASEEFKSASIEELRETGLRVGRKQAGVEQGGK